MKKRILYSLVIVTFLLTLIPPQTFAAELDLNAKSAILIDANSGKILYELDPDLTLSPASMTKMMSEYLILEAIKKGELSWDQKFQVSDFAEKISRNSSLSNIELRRDTEYTVKELYEAMAIYSANGATIALAELLAGSETTFIKKMNDKGKELGLENYKFVNSTGLNNRDLMGNQPEGTGPDEENMLSARATAKLAYRLINDFPEVLKTASIPKKTFRPGTKDSVDMLNWNWMLPGMEGYLTQFTYEGVDGLKTGSTDLAGSNFTSTAERNGVRLISVVMKTNSRIARFKETKKLLDYGFTQFEKKEVFPAGYKLKNESMVPVEKGKENQVEIATNKPISILVKIGGEDQYQPKFILDKKIVNEKGSLTAPIKKGTKVGVMTVVDQSGQSLGYITDKNKNSETVDLVTTSTVEKANWFVLTIKSIGGLFRDVWTSVSKAVTGLFS